eukprot:13643622-Alexandrium_andersonii.AAC.1
MQQRRKLFAAYRCSNLWEGGGGGWRAHQGAHRCKRQVPDRQHGKTPLGRTRTRACACSKATA